MGPRINHSRPSYAKYSFKGPSSTPLVDISADGKVGAGMTVITPLKEAHHRSLILAIFTSCGRARFMDEKYFDTCTALAGSGPAFVALVLEAMADGGVMMGLPRAEALELAAQSTCPSINDFDTS